MTKEVLITIEGQQIGSEDAPIIETALGTYHFKDGKHYIQYEEMFEEQQATSKNIIKIAPTKVVLTKKMIHSSEMVFDLKEVTQTVYYTSYGDLTLDINTSSIILKEEEDRIELNMKYALSTEDAHVSDNSIRITITKEMLTKGILK